MSRFGYCLHLIADTKYELPVACQATNASAAETLQAHLVPDILSAVTGSCWKGVTISAPILVMMITSCTKSFGAATILDQLLKFIAVG